MTDDTVNATTTDGSGGGSGGGTSLARAIGPKLLVFFIIGDILGTTIYALTGTVSERVGGALWLPFLLAFVVAFMTAFSYLELVGKYPRAAGAALYTHQAFRRPFLTFLVAFTVMCSGSPPRPRPPRPSAGGTSRRSSASCRAGSPRWWSSPSS
ncbi:hypothetical protein GCM10023199_56500 [Actinomycetospora chibensis]